MKWIKFISSLVISYVLGFTLNKGLSATNTFEGINKWTYDIPYIFTISLNEMFLIVLLTMIVFLFLYCYYSKSRVSKQQLFILLVKSIWIEIVIFSFIIGTLTNKVLEDLKNNNTEFFEYFPWLCVMLVFSSIIFVAMYSDYLRDKSINNKYTNDLYKSREELLKIMDFYLKNTNRFSIVGEWGIGKTKLITNFFKGEYFYKENNQKYYYKNNYKHIYIDASAYANNQKIIEVLEDELNEVFKKNKIFKIGRNISRELFVSSNECINFIRRIFFFEKTLEDSKENLNKKIEEYQVSANKSLVLCIDNLERIADRERIISLLAIVDELFSNDVKKIYIYDEKYMEKLFDKEQFKKYIEKYSELKIIMQKLKIEEIIEKNKKLQELIKIYLNIMEKILEESNKSLHKQKVNLLQKKIDLKNNIDINQGGVIEKQKDLINKIEQLIKENTLEIEEIGALNTKMIANFFNPRYTLGMEKFINSNYLNYSIERLFEYKLIIDLFSKFDLSNKMIRKIFFKNKTYKYRKKEDELYELHNGKIKKEEDTVEGEIKEKKKKCLSGKADDLYKFILYCYENDIDNKNDIIQEILGQKRSYVIEDMNTFLGIVEIYLEKELNICIANKFKLELNEKLSLDLVRVSLILNNLSEVKKLIKKIYNKNLEYEGVNVLLKMNPNNFIDCLKKEYLIDIDKLIKKINKEYLNLNKTNNDFLKAFDKKRLRKEVFILNNLKKIKTEEEAELEFFLDIDFFNRIEAGEMEFNSVFTIYDGNIKIVFKKTATIICSKNVDFYIEKVQKIKNNSEARKFLMELFLLKERITE
ncbi:MAG: P-loop NTPase fold protein [Clostridium sp.]